MLFTRRQYAGCSSIKAAVGSETKLAVIARFSPTFV